MQKLTYFYSVCFRKQEEARLNAVEVEKEVEQASGMVEVRKAVVPVQAQVNCTGMCLGYLKKRFNNYVSFNFCC